MKKRNFLYFLPLAALMITGCNKGSKGGGEQKGGDQPEEKTPAVTGVTIADPDETTVLDGTRVSLKATVAGEEGVSQKVTWTSSDSSVATVTNGVVNFLKVSEEKKVSITATSSSDSQFKDDVEFTVEHSPFDLKNSRGNPDYSLFLEDGKFIVEDPQDVALIFADIHDTRWYAEATITITELDKSDAWPKFGIMASERDDGFWVHEQSHQVFFYADTPSAATTWTGLNVVPEDAEATNWAWAGQLAPGTASPAMKLGEAFKMGFMRDGNKFYTFYGKETDVTLGLVNVCEYNGFGDQPNYVWVGGWKSAVEVSDPKAIVGDAIDAIYEAPEGISLKSTAETVYLGETYQIKVTSEGLWNRNKLTYSSDNEAIATVDANGLVTANATTAGFANITVGYEGTELSATFVFEVTDDEAFKVVLDGELNDLIWSEEVKTNSYLLKKNNDYYVRIYGAKNSRGLYLFMDYNVKELANCNPNEWWTWENVEFRLANDNKAWSGQYWVSSMNGGSFVSVGSGEKPEQVFYKALTLGEDGLYHGAFEMFVPYGDDCVTKGQATYACFGFAPKAGWYNGYNWYAAIGDGTLNITANGFAHDDNSTCEDAHEFGAWITDVAPTCLAEGSAHRVCKYCGEVETKKLDIDPEAHNFDYEHAVVSTPATCIATGVGTATCTICGATESTTLPIDPTNHAGAYEDGMYTCCHVNVENGQTLTLDNLNDGGWAAHETNLATLIPGTSWTYEYEYELTTNGIGGNWWRGVLPFAKAEEGDIAVIRFDWWGWVDDRNGDGQSSISANLGNAADNTSIYRNTEWYNQKEGGIAADFETCMTESHVRAVVVRDGDKLNSTFYIKAPSIDFTYEYHFNLSGVTTSAVTLGVTAEFGKAVVSNVHRVA